MSKEKQEEPKGVLCKCGHFEKFSLWVYAHQNVEIAFECPACGKKYIVYGLYAEEEK